MSNIEMGDSGINNDVSALEKLLKGPEKAPEVGVEPETEAELPIDPKLKVTTQRNTVAPQAQESAPEEASAEEDESEGESPIQAPNSWDAEAKAKWEKLPSDLKALVSAREAERETAVSQKLQEAADVRKKAEIATGQTQQLQNAYEQRLNVLAKQLESNVPAEFRAIQTPQDLARLAETDPAAVQRFFVWREMANSVLGEIQQLEVVKQQNFARQQDEVLSRETKSLVEKWPEVMDAVKGPALRNEITSLLHNFGFSNEEISGITDHRILLFAREYMQGQKALKASESAKAKVTAKPLPKVMKSGQGEATGPRGLDKASLTRTARSGDMSSTQAALEKLLAS